MLRGGRVGARPRTGGNSLYLGPSTLLLRSTGFSPTPASVSCLPRQSATKSGHRKLSSDLCLQIVAQHPLQVLTALSHCHGS